MWPSKRKKFIRNAHTTNKKVIAEFAHRTISAIINARRMYAKTAVGALFVCICARSITAETVKGLLSAYTCA